MRQTCPSRLLLAAFLVILTGAGARAQEAEASEAFLAELAKRPGAERTASGLVYIETAPGYGGRPTIDDTVRLHYRGTLRDGTRLDSSPEGEPFTAPLRQVLPCWVEALQRMQPGARATIGCPASLAYGEEGAGRIPAGSALIFELELLAIRN